MSSPAPVVCGPALPSPPWTHGAGRETQPAGARWAPCPHGASWGRHRQVAEGGTAKNRAAAGARVPRDWPEQQSPGGFSDSPERPGHPALSPPVVGAAVAWHASRPPAPGSPASGAPPCTQAGRQSRGAWGRGSHAARARPQPAEFAHVTQPSPASTSRLSEAGGTAPPSQGQARCPRSSAMAARRTQGPRVSPFLWGQRLRHARPSSPRPAHWDRGSCRRDGASPERR